MYGRHHAIRDIIYEARNAARLRPIKEATVDASGQRPADIFFPDWSRGQPLTIDVTVTHFSQTSSHFKAELGYSASERAAQAKVTAKERLYKEQCTAQNVDFMAAAICSYGGWLPEGTAFNKRLAACLAESSGEDSSIVTSNLWQRLSVASWCGNAGIRLQITPIPNWADGICRPHRPRLVRKKFTLERVLFHTDMHWKIIPHTHRIKLFQLGM